MEIRFTNHQYTTYDGAAYQYDNGGLVNPNYRYYKQLIESGDTPFGMTYGYERYVANNLSATYAFKEKYIINATGRYDGSNLLGKSSVGRWLPSWNLSGKWNAHEESFFNAENRILSALAIRGSYGIVGSLAGATNAEAIFYNQVTYRPYEEEKETEIILLSLANDDLTWEKMNELNIGTDFQLFNKIDLTFDYYNRKMFDLIGPIRTSGIGGQAYKTANFSDMKGSGYEFSIGGNVFKKENGLNWRTNFNFAVNRNQVVTLETAPSIWELVSAEGAALVGNAQRGLYSVKFDGLNPDYGYPTYIDGYGRKNTYIDWQSNNTDYLIYHGPVDPKFTGGFFNQLSYKNFTLGLLFTFATGNFVRLQPIYDANYVDYGSMTQDMVNRWLMPGDEEYTNIPSILDQYTKENLVLDADGYAINADYPYNAYNYSDQRVAKGDFVRLKNFSFAYNVPKKLINRIGLGSGQLTFVGNNVWLIYSDKKLNGADPEFFNNGGVAMPIPKQYTLSLKVGF